MPAELDYLADGTAAFVSTETAWHREGTILPDGITYDEAIKHGGLDWEVEKVPHFVKQGWVNRWAEYVKSPAS